MKDNDTHEMDLGPTPAMLIALRDASGMKWPRALPEFIDNGFDAGATRLAVTFGANRCLTIEDDGNGCDNPQAMLQLGNHYKRSTTRVGQFGVGLKDAACWLWGKLKITTVTKTHQHVFMIDWARFAKQAKWGLPNPITTPAITATGTKLEFSGIHKSPPSKLQLLADELSYLFTPGLLDGKQLVFRFPKKKPIQAKPHRDPPLEHIIEDAFTVDGRGVKLRLGIVKEGHKNMKPGLSYCHHHRVILPATGFGCGPLSIARATGWVFLDSKWGLTSHKDNVVAEQREALSEAVFERCRETLEAGQKQAVSVASRDFNMQLTTKMRAMLALTAKKAKRKSPTSRTPGAGVKPTGSGVKHAKAKRTQSGISPLQEDIIGKLCIDWRAFDDETFGAVDLPGSRVWMNEDNAFLSEMKASGNLDAILMAAIGMYVDTALASNDRQMLLPGMKDLSPEFATYWARIMASRTDGKAKE